MLTCLDIDQDLVTIEVAIDAGFKTMSTVTTVYASDFEMQMHNLT